MAGEDEPLSSKREAKTRGDEELWRNWEGGTSPDRASERGSQSTCLLKTCLLVQLKAKVS